MADEHGNHDAKHDDHGKSHGGGGHGGGHGGGGGHEEGHEGAPEWLISFADNVALMMGFFVILLAMNMGPKGSASAGEASQSADAASATSQPAPNDMIDLAISLREAFNNPVSIDSTVPGEQSMVRRLRLRRGVGDPQDDGPKGKGDNLQSIRPTDYHQLSGAISFDDASTVIKDGPAQVLEGVALRVKGKRMIIELRGHTSAAEAFRAGDHGMKLSFDRAIAVGTALEKAGLEWGQLRVIACGDNDRVKAVAYSEPEQQMNQRVEVIVTDEVMPEYAGQ